MTNVPVVVDTTDSSDSTTNVTTVTPDAVINTVIATPAPAADVTTVVATDTLTATTPTTSDQVTATVVASATPTDTTTTVVVADTSAAGVNETIVATDNSTVTDNSTTATADISVAAVSNDTAPADITAVVGNDTIDLTLAVDPLVDATLQGANITASIIAAMGVSTSDKFQALTAKLNNGSDSVKLDIYAAHADLKIFVDSYNSSNMTVADILAAQDIVIGNPNGITVSIANLTTNATGYIEVIIANTTDPATVASTDAAAAAAASAIA